MGSELGDTMTTATGSKLVFTAIAAIALACAPISMLAQRGGGHGGGGGGFHGGGGGGFQEAHAHPAAVQLVVERIAVVALIAAVEHIAAADRIDPQRRAMQAERDLVLILPAPGLEPIPIDRQPVVRLVLRKSLMTANGIPLERRIPSVRVEV